MSLPTTHNGRSLRTNWRRITGEVGKISTKNAGKGRIKLKDVIYDCDDTGADKTYQRLSTAV